MNEYSLSKKFFLFDTASNALQSRIELLIKNKYHSIIIKHCEDLNLALTNGNNANMMQ